MKRKRCALSHTGVEAEPLARIRLVMSAIWNVESLPLVVTALQRGCPEPVRPLPPAPGHLSAPEAAPARLLTAKRRSRTSAADHI